jgi:hypothetical protein
MKYTNFVYYFASFEWDFKKNRGRGSYDYDFEFDTLF